MYKLRRYPILILAVLSGLACCQIASAGPTQEEVFKSIQDNVGAPTDYRKFLMVISALVGVIIVASLLSSRKKGPGIQKPVNHQGKLLKEIARGIAFRPRELKQLKILAEQVPLPNGESVKSPLTLVLCPSVLARAVQNPRCKADRRVIQQVLRRSIATPALAHAPAAVARSVDPEQELKLVRARQIVSGGPVKSTRFHQSS